MFYLNILKNNFIILFITFLALYLVNNSLVKTSLLLLLLKEQYKTVYIINDFYTGYYKVHPFLFYYGILTLYVYSFKNTLIKLNFLTILIILIISFLLGSLWALHQSV